MSPGRGHGGGQIPLAFGAFEERPSDGAEWARVLDVGGSGSYCSNQSASSSA